MTDIKRLEAIHGPRPELLTILADVKPKDAPEFSPVRLVNEEIYLWEKSARETETANYETAMADLHTACLSEADTLAENKVLLEKLAAETARAYRIKEEDSRKEREISGLRREIDKGVRQEERLEAFAEELIELIPGVNKDTAQVNLNQIIKDGNP